LHRLLGRYLFLLSISQPSSCSVRSGEKWSLTRLFRLFTLFQFHVSPQAAWFSIVRTVSPQFEDKAGKNAGNDRAGGDCNYSHSSEKWSLTLFICSLFICSFFAEETTSSSLRLSSPQGIRLPEATTALKWPTTITAESKKRQNSMKRF